MSLFNFAFLFSTLLFAAEPDPVILEATVAPPAALFSTNHVGLDDFTIEWLGLPIEKTTVQLLPKTLEWAHLGDRTIVPRAVLEVSAEGAKSGRAVYASRTIPLFGDSNRLSAVFSVVLLAEASNEIVLDIERQGKVERGRLKITYVPSRSDGTRVFFDSSCSSFNLDAHIAESEKKNNWMSIACRLHNFQGTERDQSLEVTVFWANVGQKIEVNSVLTPSQKLSRWFFLLSGTSQLVLQHGKTAIEIEYSIPEHRKKIDLGLGIGPYFYQFESEAERFNGMYPVPTFYGSYRFSTDARLILFDMTTVAKKVISDFGGYLQFNYLRMFDDRLRMTLMIGSHAVAYPIRDNFYIQPDFAQGFEMAFTDFFARRTNLSLGAFIYPSIKDQYYFNVWLRLARPLGFVELNYISWQRLLDSGQPVIFRSGGVSVGTHLVSFF